MARARILAVSLLAFVAVGAPMMGTRTAEAQSATTDPGTLSVLGNPIPIFMNSPYLPCRPDSP